MQKRLSIRPHRVGERDNYLEKRRELEYVSGCKDLNVDIFVIGEDWGSKPHNLAVESYLKSAGKQIKQVLYNPRTSSTTIKQNVIAQTSNVHNLKRAIAQ